MSCHLKRGFSRRDFLLKYHQKPPSPHETEHKQKGKKEKKEHQESPQIKGEVNILRGGKHFSFKNPF
jgi:hypothetical protein